MQQSDPNPPLELVLERRLDAPRMAIWRCWIEPALIEQWFCPKPWFVSDVRSDLSNLVVELYAKNGAVVIARTEKPMAAMISYEDYLAVEETLRERHQQPAITR